MLRPLYQIVEDGQLRVPPLPRLKHHLSPDQGPNYRAALI